MNAEFDIWADGICFSERLCSAFQRAWGQLGDDAANTVVDIQRSRRPSSSTIAPEREWSLYFASKEIAVEEAILTIQGFPVHIRLDDRPFLRGKKLDFQDMALFVMHLPMKS